ncbi:MAG: hypothetical protein KDI71_19595 [Xanthomonadales bacterium]|nr:hypothetical protein [Xanthomonadales bacterium]
MLAQSLIVTSALIILLLGLAHLYYTFVGSKLRPRDAAVETAMAQSHPGITTQTTLWRAWVGFNASHSLGAMLFGLIYAYLALYQAQLLFTSAFLMALGLVFLAAYLVLGFRYWFSVPRNGIALASACYLTGWLASVLS